MLLFTLDDGTEYEFDQDRLPLAEAIAVKTAAGLGITDFLVGIRNMDPVALKAMVWLVRKRAGEAVRFADVEFEVFRFCESLRQTDTQEDEDAVPPVQEPTMSGSDTGTTPPSGVPAISVFSPSTSG